ncbi:MAG: GtrA family protein [Caulobacterales bacterium]|jgi:dolichol-phosphate mannosyltransferase
MLKELVRFGVVGAIGVAINLGIYALGIYVGFHYLAAAMIAWMTAVLVGFVLNRLFTFKSNAPVHVALPRVVAVYAGQQALILAIIALLVEVFHADKFKSYLVALPPAVAFSFFAMRHWALPRLQPPGRS